MSILVGSALILGLSGLVVRDAIFPEYYVKRIDAIKKHNKVRWDKEQESLAEKRNLCYRHLSDEQLKQVAKDLDQKITDARARFKTKH